MPSEPDEQADTGVMTPARAPSSQADDRGGTVRHDHLNGERGHLAGAALVHRVIRLDDLLAATQTGADDDRERSGSTSGVPAVSQSWLPRYLAIRWTYDMRRSSSRVMWSSMPLLEVAADAARAGPTW